MPPKIVIITGPTASGKTALGIEVAEKYGGEVISADSMQIYKKMDIGTAKPTADEIKNIPHHMIDIINPDENFSVSKYVERASEIADDILQRGKLPIIVGGTGLYIDSLTAGRDFAPAPSDENLRLKLEAEYDEKGGEFFLEKLSKFDPKRAEKLAPADKRRIVRAIEVYTLSGKTITEHDEYTKSIPPRYDSAMIVLSYKDRADLYARIDKRVDIMVEMGLIDEVKSLLSEGISENCTAMQAIGYKEIVSAINGDCTMDEAIDRIKRESRRYAKRQLTWFRRHKEALWLEWDKVQNFDFARQVSTAFFSEHGIK